ncbi:uncharacterized protein TNCV_3734081 [Trichonephila clavipes]|nr:uncharacterized protein TNCV_3734081 [Trichonephila clavipes]
MACDAKDCGFQMLNEDEIVTSMQEESNPVDDELDEDEDNNNNESSKGPSNADAFSALETSMEWYEQQPECCPTQLLRLKRIRELAAKKRRCIMVQQKKAIIFHNIGKIATFCTYFASPPSTFPACNDFRYSYSIRFHILHGSHSVLSYPNAARFQLIRINDILLYLN